MADWSTTSSTEKAFNLTGPPTGYSAFTATDDAKQERPQVMLIERLDNNGLSLNTSEGQEHAIGDHAKKKGLNPTECDWFRIDDDGKAQAIDVSLRPESAENPKYTEFSSKGFTDEQHRLRTLQEHPPVTVDRPEASERSLTADEAGRLREAFPDGFDLSRFEGPELDSKPERNVAPGKQLDEVSFAGTREVVDLNPDHGFDP